jgi:CubicO group peptidase (beta-lactamase class C family)
VPAVPEPLSVRGQTPAPAWDAPLGQALDKLLQPALAAGRLPGAVVAVCGRGLHHVQAWGQRAADGIAVPAGSGLADWAPLGADAIYDCASLTKAVVTAPLVQRLLWEGACQLDDPVRRYLPLAPESAQVTVRHLLTHSSALPASLDLAPPWQGLPAARSRACASVPTQQPGTLFRYSDINFILLDALVEQLTGQPFEALARDWVFQPLAMADSGFNPLGWAPLARLVPTEIDTLDGMLLGQVHDPTCRRMGGVAGHAGLFSTVHDLSRYATMLLQEGCLDGVQVMPAGAVAAMLANASPPGVPWRRGLGWDIDSPYARARGAVYDPSHSAGHTGFTGCALWLDRSLQGFHVLLSNRVHPQARQGIVDLYESVATEAATAVRSRQRGVAAP